MTTFSRFCLFLPRHLLTEMIAQATDELPQECVGMLAGTREGHVICRFPLVNALADPRRFESEPRSMFAAEKARRVAGLEFLAVYHSHPSSPPVPSKLDLAWHYSPEVQCIIISLATQVPEVRAYWLGEDRFETAQMQIVEAAFPAAPDTREK